ncbi:MAG TPA: D-sedoheptulose 7-phosphate isomerase [Magnetospirillaceae bacterium]|jgi:D-sedoheptulose 7-phosphate isomerase
MNKPLSPASAGTDESRIVAEIETIIGGFQRLRALAPDVAAAGRILIEALQSGGKVMFAGNGGSAADAQHLAAELSGRFLHDRKSLAGLALTTDTSALTAIGNDYGFEHVFSRPLRGLGRKGDALVAISTSGNSPNVLEAIKAAREIGIKVVGLTGAAGGKLATEADVCIKAPADRTDHIQEMHIAVGHMLCGIVEEACG